MKPDEFDARMRALECYHALRFPPDAWIILRLDGRHRQAAPAVATRHEPAALAPRAPCAGGETTR